ncbi:OPT superfamily oligopeptide transporter [Naviculisporaceae sp. PSN 640]
MEGRSFTIRAVLSGLIIGVLINISNTYYGLRVGAGSQMSMISALLGFAIFKLLSTHTVKRLGPAENVLLTSVATATGCMPLTTGTIGVIPALEYIIGSDENGPLPQNFGALMIWACGLSFFGIIFTALLREHFIERERRLPWPGASATAHLIRTLHGPTKRAQEVDETSPLRQQPIADAGVQSMTTETLALSAQNQTAEVDWKAGMNALFGGATVSGLISAVLFVVPTLHQIPIFGHGAATTWLWTLDLSPGFLGQGIIMGPVISLHMLLGAIIGWGILSPLAKHRGWAPGDVGDWSSGSRGWIIWISLASLLSDASVKLSWLVLRPIWRKYLSGRYHSKFTGYMNRYLRWAGGVHRENGYTAIPDDDSAPPAVDSSTTRVSGSLRNRQQSLERGSATESSKPATSGITTPILGVVFAASLAFCTLAVHIVFGHIIPWYYTPLAIALSLPMAAVGIRSIAETDYNPESAIISQLVFAILVPGSMPFAIVINLISAAMTVAAANQAGDLAYDLKVGSLIGAHPDAQIYGQVIGSVFGSLVSCGVYRLYSSQYTIPGPLFPVPSAYLVLSTAQLLLGRGLPEGVFPFALAAALVSTACTVVKIRYEHRRWQTFVPSGVSVAIGIYLLPSFSIIRALGGLLSAAYLHLTKDHRGSTVVFASGLVLGESLSSLVTVLLALAGVNSA